MNPYRVLLIIVFSGIAAHFLIAAVAVPYKFVFYGAVAFIWLLGAAALYVTGRIRE